MVLAQMPQRPPPRRSEDWVRCQCHHYQGHSSELGGGLFSLQKQHFDHRPMGAAEYNTEDTDRVIPKVEPLGRALDTLVCAIPAWGWWALQTGAGHRLHRYGVDTAAPGDARLR